MQDFIIDGVFEELTRQGGVAQIANEARPASQYMLNSILPERHMEEYDVERASVIVRPTMAGVVAMDSPYPRGGIVQYDAFKQGTLKVGIDVDLNEATLRKMQALYFRLTAKRQNAHDRLVEEFLNFYDLVVMQAHFDMAEWMRGQVLTTGKLELTYNQKQISVDYGVPAENLLSTRTGAAAYGAAESEFWKDVRRAARLLPGGVRRIITNSTTAADIVFNPANSLRVVEQGDTFYVVQREVERNGVNTDSRDKRESLRIEFYDGEGDLLDPQAGTVKNVKFIPDGYVVFIGLPNQKGYAIGQGSQQRPDNNLELGYTHLGPTVEGNGEPGRWGRVYRPESAPWTIKAQAAANLLPVLMNPKSLVVASTEIVGL